MIESFSAGFRFCWACKVPALMINGKLDYAAWPTPIFYKFWYDEGNPVLTPHEEVCPERGMYHSTELGYDRRRDVNEEGGV